MKITRETKVQKQDEKAVKTIIPATIRDVMDIEVGTTLIWTLENENEIKIRKKSEK